jgi:hypothetical protein
MQVKHNSTEESRVRYLVLCTMLAAVKFSVWRLFVVAEVHYKIQH